MKAPNVAEEFPPLLRGEAVALMRGATLLFDAVEDQDAWLIQSDDESATLYVVAGASIHELRGDKTQAPPDEVQEHERSWESSYRRFVFTPQDTYELAVTRKTVSRDEIHLWTFSLKQAQKPVAVELLRTEEDVDEPEREEAKVRFVEALVRGIATAAEAG